MPDTHAQKRRKLNKDSAPVQTIYEDFTSSDDSNNSDIFEDVDLSLDQSGTDAGFIAQGNDDDDADANASLEITLEPSTSKQLAPRPKRRAPLTRAEKKLRLHVHKAHVRCLFYHLKTRNAWCNVDHLQATLRKLVPVRTRRLFEFDEGKSRAQYNQAFNTGLEEVGKIWKEGWKVTERGMRRPFWAESARELENQLSAYSAEPSTSFEDFVQAAKGREGSRDTAAQLFCVLMRSLDVDTRLVCSLQPLPFSGEAKTAKPQKPEPTYARAFTSNSSPLRSPRPLPNQSRPPAFNSPLRRLGLHTASTPKPPPPRISSPRPTRTITPEIKDSPYPIFWVEVFNPALNRWVPVDSLVRQTINKPKTGFEPPAVDPLNNMSYVIAFEADFSAHDVTRRYTRHYNAKTRRSRVESTHDGETWMRELLAKYDRPWNLERYIRRDADEAGELAERGEQEEMPTGVEDFKGHPKYALERHLKRHEAVPPGTKRIAIFSAGSKKATENVYRRGDIQIVRSAEQWYRLGKVVKKGEQPMKRAVPKRAQQQQQQQQHQRLQPSDEEEEDDKYTTEVGTRLYAESQTQPYIAPPVINDTVPTNSFGNLEIFTPSMVPHGAVHIRHPDSLIAARILGISHAPAVTGFKFQGRKGTAVTEGVVVVFEHAEAVEAVVEGIQEMRDREEEARRTRVVLGMWRVMVRKLRVMERVREYESESDQEEGREEDEEMVEVDKEVTAQRERERDEVLRPIATAIGAKEVWNEESESESENRGGFVTEEGEGKDEHDREGGGFVAMAEEGRNEDDDGARGSGFLAEEKEDDEDGEGGGFLADEDEDDGSGGGGFLAEEDDDYEEGGFMMDDDD